MCSPVENLPRLGSRFGIDLRVKRDDLLPLSGGGNKVRKGLRIVAEAEAAHTTALVTTGGLQSNHARVTALLAAARGWRCSLVLHGAPGALDDPKGNLLLMRLAGAEITICDPEEISGHLEAAMERLRDAGERPYLVPGGGHCLAGALAYTEAITEVQAQLDGWIPDWIVHASGTGATQAGILAGCARAGWDSRVLGVSVARRNPRGREVVAAMCAELDAHFGSAATSLRVDFRDGWVGAGYEQADESVLRTIRHAAREEGLLLDPTYTGKAFTALTDLVESGEIAPGSRVLFWHTGGLPNLLASDLTREMLRR